MFLCLLVVYILLSLWSEKFNEKLKDMKATFLAGFFQTGLFYSCGSYGPLTMTLLKKIIKIKMKVS